MEANRGPFTRTVSLLCTTVQVQNNNCNVTLKGNTYIQY